MCAKCCPKHFTCMNPFCPPATLWGRHYHHFHFTELEVDKNRWVSICWRDWSSCTEGAIAMICHSAREEGYVKGNDLPHPLKDWRVWGLQVWSEVHIERTPQTLQSWLYKQSIHWFLHSANIIAAHPGLAYGMQRWMCLKEHLGQDTRKMCQWHVW